MAVLVLLQGGQAVPYELDGDEILIGRHPDCGVQLESNAVSRRHARVFVHDGRYAIEDLGSGNGTSVNGQRIECVTPLNSQDRIKLGPVLMRFEEGTAGAASDMGTTMVGVSLDDDEATIMASVESGGGFGALNVRPEEKLKGVLEISRALAHQHVALERVGQRILVRYCRTTVREIDLVSGRSSPVNLKLGDFVWPHGWSADEQDGIQGWA